MRFSFTLIATLLLAVTGAYAEPLQLDRAVDLALRHNVDIQNARNAIETQHGVMVEIRGHVFPQVGVDGSYSKRDPDLLPSFNGQTFGSTDDWQTGLFVRQVLFAGGEAWTSRTVLDAQLEQARAELATTVNQILFDVHAGFYAAYLAQADVAARAAEVQLLERQLQEMQQRRAVGTVADFDVLRVQVDLSNARVPLVRARNEARIARDHLQTLLGVEADAAGGPITRVADVAVAPAVTNVTKLDTVLTRGRLQRPELNAAQQHVDAALARTRGALSGYLPRVSLEGRYGWEKNDLGGGGSSLDGWQLRLNGQWLLFDGLSTHGQRQQQQAALDTAELTLQHTEFLIASDIRRAHAAWQEAAALVTATDKLVARAEESLRLAQARLDVGTATYLDVLSSRVALTQARTNAARATHDFARAAADLKRAMGDFAGAVQ